ncbi:winged helix-turn-helix transcriptional regulator [Phycicoccus sp. HDW14]|uniref:MarR family winged helix-turn-helix transcriptional regulator n=1 Tax=Phycicoccus sp. HDW14 TaxID=2714941 RepID=UPI00140882FD|nr:MarR family winged helix-turn-helix transcriptional regulator [Phycicoccus sp. HDW14]QIM20387.1 winged helix-turn-helix transcriptional regulator [Phycicoccus sp. HDW14]
MTDVKGPLPEVLAALFGRIRSDLSPTLVDDLRFSHVRVLLGIPAEGASVTDLASGIGMTKQGCGQFVTRLVETGHVATTGAPGDGRVRLVLRTAEGDRFLRRVLDGATALEERFAAEVGPRRYATFRRVLEELAGPRQG